MFGTMTQHLRLGQVDPQNEPSKKAKVGIKGACQLTDLGDSNFHRCLESKNVCLFWEATIDVAHGSILD